MAKYQLAANDHVLRDDGFNIPPEPRNRDWQEYQAWLAAGGVPDPYEPVVIDPPPADKRDANQRLDAGIVAAQPGMDDATQAQNRSKAARTTEDEVVALQVQVDALTVAMQSMLTAQIGKTPR